MKFITIFTLFLLSIVSAQEKNKDKALYLKDFKFGKLIVGEKPSLEALKGKVVLIDYWGVF